MATIKDEVLVTKNHDDEKDEKENNDEPQEQQQQRKRKAAATKEVEEDKDDINEQQQQQQLERERQEAASAKLAAKEAKKFSRIARQLEDYNKPPPPPISSIIGDNIGGTAGNGTTTTTATSMEGVIQTDDFSSSSSRRRRQQQESSSTTGRRSSSRRRAPVTTFNPDATSSNKRAKTATTAATTTATAAAASSNTNTDHNNGDNAEKGKDETTTATTIGQEASTATTTTTTTNQQNKKKKSRNNNNSNSTRTQEQLDMAWICIACREAECAMDPESELLVCEGTCGRIFHVACAGLASIPSDSWKCSDCDQRRHICACCQQYGIDDEDVYKCQKPNCGFYFHEACLEMQNIVYERIEVQPPSTVLPSPPPSTSSIPAPEATTTEVDGGEGEGGTGTGTGTGTADADARNSNSKEDSTSSLALGAPPSPMICIPVPVSPTTAGAAATTTVATATEEEAEAAVLPPPPATPSTTTSPQVQLKYTCPAHVCWTCAQLDEAAAEKKEKIGGRGRGGSKTNKSKRNSTGLFQQKRDKRLFPCLENCPVSYHLTCIPPTAKFHELALLCHVHASQAELPAIDHETSYQGSVEARCDRTLQKMRNWDVILSKRAKKLGGGRGHNFKSSKNPFFPRGVVSDKRTTREKFVLGKLGTHVNNNNSSSDSTNGNVGGGDDDNNKKNSTVKKESSSSSAVLHVAATDYICSDATSNNDRLLFCLPADVQEEVHSKPPLYKHINALKYYPENKPKRIPMPKDVCNCVDTCDEHCLNRLLYVECFGNAPDSSNKNGMTKSGKTTNCRLGPKCGNRQLGLRQHVKKCKPKREKGKGWGLVTLEKVKKGGLVQEYLGDVIDEKEKEKRLQTWNLEHPNDPNYYIMCLSQGWYVDARETANMARFINHSCDPNCILLQFNVGGFMRDGIFALRDIEPGEFLSYDYHFDTKHGDKFLCRCGGANCRGTMQLKLNKETAAGANNGKKTKTQLWNEAKAQYDKDEKFLMELDEHEKKNATIGPELPGTAVASEIDEFVANGVAKDRATVIRNRIFLWRNAVAGSDFEARFGRYCLPIEGTTESAGGAVSGGGDLQPIIRRKRAKRSSSNNQKKASVSDAAVATVDDVDVLAVVTASDAGGIDEKQD